MLQVSYPGVYVQEVPSGVRTITGVSTSIGAFIGRASKGPIDRAVRLLGYADFERRFGAPHAKSDLAHAVRLFFENGGTDCYVVRVAHNARKADVTLNTLGTPPGTPVLVARAKDAGAWGNQLRVEVSYDTPAPDDTFAVRVVQVDGDTEVASEEFIGLTMNQAAPRYAPTFVTQSSALIDLELEGAFDMTTELAAAPDGYSEARRPLPSAIGDFRDALNDLVHAAAAADVRSRFEMSVNDGPYFAIDLRADPTWTAFTGDRTAVATEIQSRINSQLGAVAPGVTVGVSFETVHGTVTVMRITSNAAAPQSAVRVRRASSNDLAAPLMLGLDQGGVEPTKYGAIRPAPSATLFTDDADTLAALQQQDFDRITVSGVDVDLRDSGGVSALETTGATDRWYVDDGSVDVHDHNDGVREKLNILAAAINSAASVPARAEVWGYRLALVPTEGTVNSTVTVATSNAGGGGLVDLSGNFTENTRQYALGNSGASPFQDGPGQTGLDDDGNPPDSSDYLGSAVDQSGMHALDPVDLFNLMVLPGDEDVAADVVESLWGPLSVYCQSRRAFLVMDPPAAWTSAATGQPAVVQDTSLINTLRASLVKDHAAIFYPRLLIRVNGVQRTIGPAGAIAGLMARTDASRGVWKAPAGIEAGVRGIAGLNVELTDAQNGVLNKKGVNCIRVFPNGIVNWGARTLDGDDDFGSEWKYVPIRRLALFLEESLYRGTRWVVFEPNDEPLWANIRLNINAFMNSLFRQGAFQGASPREAYFVKCDSETTTQDDRNRGIVNILVGFAPLKPAEFVVISIQQIAGDL